MEKKIVYSENPGAENTDEVMIPAKERKDELGIENIIVASVGCVTSVKVLENIPDANIVSITHHAGFRGGDELELNLEYTEKLENAGVPIYVGSHSLSGVGRGISNKFGGITPVEIIAGTLRLFSQGVKVCVEISVMAADAGLIPTDKEVIALGGTANGVDTAMILKPAHMGNFFDLKINEIIAMPRP